MHLAPGAGRSRNVAGALVDVTFPETASPAPDGLLRPIT
jgi:hypothetical protein